MKDEKKNIFKTYFLQPIKQRDFLINIPLTQYTVADPVKNRYVLNKGHNKNLFHDTKQIFGLRRVYNL